MSYRDDREALRARVEALETKLAESDSASAEQRAQYERELAKLRARAPARSPTGLIALSAALMVMVMGAGIAFVLVRAPATPLAVPAAAAPLAEGPAPATVQPPRTTQVLHWPAKVHSASGVKLSVGVRCTIAAVVESSPDELVARSARVTLVQCGKESLYVPGAAGTKADANVGQATRETPTAAFDLRFATPADAPLQVSVDSLKQTALVVRGAEPTLRVQLDVDPLASREAPRP